MRFFVGLHQPSDAKHFNASFISVTRLRSRKSAFAVSDWIMDSGAFSAISTHGGYPHGVDEYAAHIRRWRENGNLLAAVSQDYMCEPVVLAKTSMTVAQHQRLTLDRYDALMREDVGVYIMPVLQGYSTSEYVDHLTDYGDRLGRAAWVGVGSICKRNTNPQSVAEILRAIKASRPDLKLHGFGLKITALHEAVVRDRLYSADSMAWSYAARMAGRSANDWREAARFVDCIDTMHIQCGIEFPQ